MSDISQHKRRERLHSPFCFINPDLEDMLLQLHSNQYLRAESNQQLHGECTMAPPLSPFSTLRLLFLFHCWEALLTKVFLSARITLRNVFDAVMHREQAAASDQIWHCLISYLYLFPPLFSNIYLFPLYSFIFTRTVFFLKSCIYSSCIVK